MLAGYLAYTKPLWLTEYDARTPGMHAHLGQRADITAALAFCFKCEVEDFGLENMPARMAEFKAAAGAGVPVEPPPADAPQFTLGFLAWSKVDPELLGRPLETERGFAPGVSLCETTTGSLYWIDERKGGAPYTWSDDLSECFGFRRRADGRRFAWRPGMAHAVEVV